MRIAVLASPDSWYARDLQRAAGHDHELVVLPFSEIQTELEQGRLRIQSAGFDLLSFDAVIVRTMPVGSLEQVVFRMDALAGCEANRVLVVNPAKAIEAAVDKYLTSAKIVQAGLLSPRTRVCQTVDDAMDAFERLGRNVVVKPLFGSEGRGITRVSDIDLAYRAFKLLTQIGAVMYLQEFIDHEGEDYRLFVLGTRVVGMKRRNTADWRTNVSRGATSEVLEVTDELAEIALRAAKSVGAWVAGVDVLPGRDGRRYVIEVNAVPGWRSLAKTLDLDIARLVLDYVAQQR